MKPIFITYSMSNMYSSWASSFSFDYMSVIKEAIKQWDNACSLEFIKVDSGANLNITTAPIDNYNGITGNGILIANNQPDTSYASGFLNTLLHELGHYVGCEHTSNSSSIMYPYHTSLLSLSVSDKAIAASLHGPEVTNSELLQGNTGLVTAFYATAFDRVPDSGGFLYFEKELDDSVIDASQLAHAFVSSSEFGNKSTTQYVDTLYDNAFDRVSDASEVNYWASQIDSHNMSKEQVFLFFAQSPEMNSHLNSLYSSNMWYD